MGQRGKHEISERKRTEEELRKSEQRAIKTLEELKKNIENREVVVGRELTKKFETIYRGTIQEVLDQLNKSSVKGEFVVIFSS